MRTRIFIDWNEVTTKVDVLKAILLQAKAPEWHGIGLDAIEDSFVVGNINAAKPPYEFHLKNLNSDDEDMKSFQNSLIVIFTECVRKYAGATLTVE